MLKISYGLYRLPHLSHQEFLDYWLNHHGPLVRNFAGAMKVKRYVQVHNMDTEFNETLSKVRGGMEPFDGVAELWFESREDFDAGHATKERRAAGRALLEDEENFIDKKRSTMMLGEENPIVSG